LHGHENARTPIGEGIERLASAWIRQQLDQSFRLAHRQRLQEGRIDEAENRRVRADTQGQRRHRGERKALRAEA
jgi:hypothetical protein